MSWATAHHFNDNEIPASLATVNRRVCEPSTTHEVWPTVIRSDRIGWAGDSFLEAKAALTLPGKVGQLLPLHGQAPFGRGHVDVDGRSLGLGLHPDGLHEAGQVARFGQRRIVPEATAEAGRHVVEHDLVAALGKVVRDRHQHLDRLAIALVRLQRHERLQLLARLDRVGEQPDRLDHRDLPPRLDLDLAVDGLDPHRGHGVANQEIGDRGQRAEQGRRPRLPGVARSAERVAQRDRLVAPELERRAQAGGELLRQVALGVDGTGEH